MVDPTEYALLCKASIASLTRPHYYDMSDRQCSRESPRLPGHLKFVPAFLTVVLCTRHAK